MTSSTTSLTCPKCASEMRSYERNRVLVDQCTGCGGLFLDRGELEALVAAENAWHGQQSPSSPAQAPTDSAQPYAPQPYPQQSPPAQHPQPAPPGQQAYGQPPAQAYGNAPYARYSNAPYAAYSKHGYYPGRRRKRSFLSELFDD